MMIIMFIHIYTIFLSDINECASDSNLCNQRCNNVMGSFQCSCDEGYSLANDRKTCMDINECILDLHNCQQGCINTIGGFRCTCFSGYELNSDETTCSGTYNNHYGTINV